MSSIKIMICCHKETPRLKNDVFVPILLGAQYADSQLKEEFKNDVWDCSGDNIGNLHPYCAELTALYWAWKNYDKLGNPDYIGLFHYRRLFNFMDELPEKDLWKCAFFDFDNTTKNRFGWNENVIREFCKGSDLILPHKEQILNPNDWKTPATLEIHYKHSHYPEDFDQVMEFIEKNYPQYYEAAKQAANSYEGYFCNMFIMTREKFFDYAQWLFGIILPMADKLPISNKKYAGEQKRVLGFLGERLFNIWITKQASGNIKIKEVQRLIGYLTSEDQEAFIKTYGRSEYKFALSVSKRTVLAYAEQSNEIMRLDNLDVYPTRISYKPKVSILVSVYNVSEFLAECIESLIHQTLKEVEFIFVDNASTDNSREILMRYYQEDVRIAVIEHKVNEGLSNSRNTAMKYMKGEYFGFVDSDDICDRQMFEKLYKKAIDTQADIVTCCMMEFWTTVEDACLHRPLEWFGDSDRLLPLSERPQQLMEPAAWCKLFRTAYIKDLDYFEFRPGVRSWEDVPAMTSAFIQTNRIATVQEALYFYRQRTAGNLSSNMTYQNVDEFISGAQAQQMIMDKHHYFDLNVQSYIEEFKLLFAEWMLSKMRRKDIPYLFHHVACLFRFKDRKYLERVFTLYPNRKRFYYILMSRSCVLYFIGKSTYRVGKRCKRLIKKLLHIQRQDVYWTFCIGPFKFKKFRKSYYQQTMNWYETLLHEREQIVNQLNEHVFSLNNNFYKMDRRNSELRETVAHLQQSNEELITKQNALVEEQKLQAVISSNLSAEKEKLESIRSTLLEKNQMLDLKNSTIQNANEALITANEAMQTSIKTLSSINEKQTADCQMLREDNKKLKNSLTKQTDIVTSLTETLDQFKTEFDGFYHAVWNTGWINVWKDYYCKNFGEIGRKVEKLKSSLDAKSCAVIDRQCYRAFQLLPRQEDADLFRYDHNRIYTAEELAGAKKALDEDRIRSKFIIPNDEPLEIPVFRFNCGLSWFSPKITQRIAGKDVIDGGAFWGDSALVFSEYGPRRIIAFEPQPETFSLLKDTIRKNGMEKLIVPVQSGLSAKQGTANLYTKGMASGANLCGIAPVEENATMQVNRVQLTSIDEYANAHGLHVGLIKLDIEGAELGAVRGALQVIQRDRPLLAISIYHTPADFLEIKPMLEELNLGYHFIVRKLVYHDLVSEIMLLGYVDDEKGDC